MCGFFFFVRRGWGGSQADDGGDILEGLSLECREQPPPGARPSLIPTITLDQRQSPRQMSEREMTECQMSDRQMLEDVETFLISAT